MNCGILFNAVALDFCTFCLMFNLTLDTPLTCSHVQFQDHQSLKDHTKKEAIVEVSAKILIFSQMCGDFWRQNIYQGSEIISKKALKRLYSLRILKKVGVNREGILKVYLRTIRPILEYGMQVWQDIPEFLSNKLESIQKKGTTYYLYMP